MAFVKGLFPGILLSWIISSILGRNHQTNNFLYIHLSNLPGDYFERYQFYWSWPLFFAASGLAWFVFANTD
ncbi:MAG: hypothetical protein AB7F98_08785 [Novosphingobium sp.]